MIRLLIVGLALLAEANYPVMATEASNECALCSVWRIDQDDTYAAIGERIEITAKRVVIPTCGDFAQYAILEDAVVKGRARRVLLSIGPSRVFVNTLCDLSSDTKLFLEINLFDSYGKVAAQADFSVYRERGGKSLLHMRAWNLAQVDPCGTGGYDGSVSCLRQANARRIGDLARQVYGAYVSVPPARRTKGFNPASFAANALRSCETEHQSAERWSYVEALQCQSHLIEEKITEFHEWYKCLAEKRQCAFPSDVARLTNRSSGPRSAAAER